MSMNIPTDLSQDEFLDWSMAFFWGELVKGSPFRSILKKIISKALKNTNFGNEVV